MLDRKRGLFEVPGPSVSHEIKEVHGVWRAVEERAHAGVGVRGPAYDREARGGHSRGDVFAARDDRVHDVVVHAELDRGIVGDGVQRLHMVRAHFLGACVARVVFFYGAHVKDI